MHRCFEILETVEHFVRFSRDLPGWRTPNEVRYDLMALASVSRIFYEPAMDALWRELWRVDLIRLIGKNATDIKGAAHLVDGLSLGSEACFQ